MRITIPDDLADLYAAYAHRAHCTLDAIVSLQLRRMATVDPQGRSLVVGQRLLELLEARLSGGPLVDGPDLERRFRRLASIHFMGIDLRLTVSQLEELARRAARQGKSVEYLTEEIAQRLIADFFYTSAGGPVAQPIDAPSPPVPGEGTPIPGLAGA